ncbi:MAG TPA: CheR family methyltransferase [Bryobacteraceae bacterium]|nr:CheR family methyltransferase [Bryobacteraceae bacterium]
MATVEQLALAEVPPLGPAEFEQIRRLAYRACGLDLKAGKEDLVNSRLLRLLRDGRFRSFHEYYRSVLEDRTGAALAHMIDALATNHTSFMREPEHFDFLRAHAAELAPSRGTFEVWSAGCSTGEEVWSLACLLDQVLPGSRTCIRGTDISNKALAVAGQAVYSAERCRPLPAGWLARYFEPQAGPAGQYRVSAALRERAVFRRLNLIERLYWAQQFPVIFCRNVMIYFDRPTQAEVVRQLERALEPGGYLFIGHAESLARIPHSLEYVRPSVFRRSPSKGERWNRSS